jgi:hypothetical protein
MKSPKTLNIYLPEELYSEISSEAQRTGQTKGEIVRARLSRRGAAPTGAILADLFGAAQDLPRNLSTTRDKAFRHYGVDHHR